MDRTRTLDGDELEKFVGSLGSLRCAIPDELVRHYLARAGFRTEDVRLERLIALAAQKFLADVANDALAHAKLRGAAQANPAQRKRGPGSTPLVLTVDDLERALREFGVPYRKPPYFADTPEAGAPAPAPTPTAPSGGAVLGASVPAPTVPSGAPAAATGGASAQAQARARAAQQAAAATATARQTGAQPQHAHANGKPA